MSRRDDEHIGHVPKMAPAHDEIASYQRTKAKGSLAARLGEVPDVPGGRGGGGVSTTILVFVVLVLLATAGLSVFLYQNLSLAEQSIDEYELRIADLERRLSVTDESMSESSVAMKVKVRELDSEIRKLWDNVWKKAKKDLAKHEARLNQQQQSIAKNEGFISSAKAQISKNDTVVAELTTQLAKAEKMQLMISSNQQKLNQQEALLERTTDKANALSSSINKLDRRVKETEEWVESINGFRRQVNRDLSALKQGAGQVPAAQ